MRSTRTPIRASPRSIWSCCGLEVRYGTVSCWRRSVLTPGTPPSGRKACRSSPDSLTSSSSSADAVAVTDDNSFSGRVRRYAQVSTAMGGLVARLAGERYLGINLDRDRHAAELKAALGGIKGPLMKVAQLLATIPDGLPKEYVQELSQLQANAPA